MIGSKATTASACRALLQPPGADVFRLRTRVPGRHRKIKLGDWRQPWLRASGALLLAVSAGIHLGLYLTGYRSIPAVGWLFLVQAVVACVLAGRRRSSRTAGWPPRRAPPSRCPLWAAYLLAVWTGLFGFREIRTRAGIAAGLIEVAAFGDAGPGGGDRGRPRGSGGRLGPARPRPRWCAPGCGPPCRRRRSARSAPSRWPPWPCSAVAPRPPRAGRPSRAASDRRRRRP